MGLFKKRATDPAEIEHLRSEIAAMGARLDAADQRLEATGSHQTELGDRVREIVTRLDTPLAPPPDGPPPPPMPSVDPAELAAIRDQLTTLASRLDGVDARITSISVELANQIDELSGEIAARDAGTPPTDEVVEELRDAQTRLANEQARYQIAFRQDLADLADRLRRT